MDSIGSRIKEFAVQKHGSIKALADALGKNPANVHKYISGDRSPGLSFLDGLKSLGCNIEWLRTGKGEMYINDENDEKPLEHLTRPEQDPLNEVLKRIERLEKAQKAAPDLLEQVQIPLYQHAVSAGPACTVSEEVEEYMPVPKKIARHPRNTFAVRVSGDSMIGAGIEEGDIIICDARGAYKTGSIVVASIDGGQTLKKIQMDKGTVTLKPANHNHDTIPITDNSDLSILGVVIAIFRILEQL